jgi:hypothetical protein
LSEADSIETGKYDRKSHSEYDFDDDEYDEVGFDDYDADLMEDEKAEEAIEEASAVIDALADAVDETEFGADKDGAEDALDDANDKLDEAELAYDDDEYDNAKDLAFEAKGIAEDAYEALTGQAYDDDEYDKDEFDYEDEYVEIFGKGADNLDDEERVEGVIERLLSSSPLEIQSSLVESIQGQTNQACAIIGGSGREILVTRSLASKCNDDELAFILAHEIAHHENDDFSRTRNSANKSVEKIITDLDSTNRLMKTKGRGFIRRALVLAGSAGWGYVKHKSHMLEVSRSHEEEADERAIELVSEAGYDTEAIEGAFRKLHGGYLPEMSYWDTLGSTHPSPKQRVNRARKNRTSKKR